MELISYQTVTPSVPATQPVLVPVDFSTCSAAALLFASQLVKCLKAPIILLHVVHDVNYKPGFYRPGTVHGLLRPFEDIAADMLEEFISDVRRDHDTAPLPEFITMLVSGLPAQRIDEVARRENAAMIVMGTHGRSGLARLANGSITEAVMRRSPVPVTVVKGDQASSSITRSRAVF